VLLISLVFCDVFCFLFVLVLRLMPNIDSFTGLSIVFASSVFSINFLRNYCCINSVLMFISVFNFRNRMSTVDANVR